MAESPFHMGVLILVLAVTGSVIVASGRTWFALILFLMYVGGMLVTLAYFLALCPNQLIRLGAVAVVPLLGLALFF